MKRWHFLNRTLIQFADNFCQQDLSPDCDVTAEPELQNQRFNHILTETILSHVSAEPEGGTELSLLRVAPGEICNLNPTKEFFKRENK